MSIDILSRDLLQKAEAEKETIETELSKELKILKENSNQNIASFEVRKEGIINFLKEIGAEKRVEIIKIDDEFSKDQNRVYEYLLDQNLPRRPVAGPAAVGAGRARHPALANAAGCAGLLCRKP